MGRGHTIPHKDNEHVIGHCCERCVTDAHYRTVLGIRHSTLAVKQVLSFPNF